MKAIVNFEINATGDSQQRLDDLYTMLKNWALLNDDENSPVIILKKNNVSYQFTIISSAKSADNLNSDSLESKIYEIYELSLFPLITIISIQIEKQTATEETIQHNSNLFIMDKLQQNHQSNDADNDQYKIHHAVINKNIEMITQLVLTNNNCALIKDQNGWSAFDHASKDPETHTLLALLFPNYQLDYKTFGKLVLLKQHTNIPLPVINLAYHAINRIMKNSQRRAKYINYLISKNVHIEIVTLPIFINNNKVFNGCFNSRVNSITLFIPDTSSQTYDAVTKILSHEIEHAQKYHCHQTREKCDTNVIPENQITNNISTPFYPFFKSEKNKVKSIFEKGIADIRINLYSPLINKILWKKIFLIKSKISLINLKTLLKITLQKLDQCYLTQ